MKFAVLDENGSLAKASSELANNQATYEIARFDEKDAFFAALKRQPAGVLAVETDCVERTAKILGDLAILFPRTIRIAFSNAFGVSRLRDLCGPANQFCFKPVCPEAVKNRVDGAMELLPLLTDPKVLAVVSGLRTLPTFSESYSVLLQELESADPNIDTIGSAIERDVGLFATILSLANSSFFGRSTKVSSPIDAVSTLGFSAIQSVVLAAPALSLLDGAQIRSINREVFWGQAQKRAEIARRIAKAERLKAVVVNECYSAALLVDVGQLVLASNYGQKYDAYLKHAESTGAALHELEYSQMQTDHAAIGACMLAMWGVSPGIVEAIWKHHLPPPGETKTDAAVITFAADWILRRLDSEDPFQGEPAGSPVLQHSLDRWLDLVVEADEACAV